MSAVKYECSRGSAAQLGAVDSAQFNGRLKLLWSKGVAGKPAGPLSVHNGVLLYPETKKRIWFFDVGTGHRAGRWKAKGVPQTGVAVADSLAFYGVAPRRDFLRANQLQTAKRVWQKNVKDIFPGPIILDNRLVASSGEGRVVAFQLDNGELAWEFRTEQRPTASASFGQGRIFQPADQGWLYALSPDSGREVFRVRLDGPLVSPVAAADRIYAAVMTGLVYALSPDDGAVIWKTELGCPVWTSPAVARGKLFVGCSRGALVALDAATGGIIWRHETGHVIRASALVIGENVVVGTLAGQLLVLKADDGSLIDSTTVSGAVEVPPVTDGRRLFVATQSGKVYCFGENYEQADAADQRIDSQFQSQ